VKVTTRRNSAQHHGVLFVLFLLFSTLSIPVSAAADIDSATYVGIQPALCSYVSLRVLEDMVSSRCVWLDSVENCFNFYASIHNYDEICNLEYEAL